MDLKELHTILDSVVERRLGKAIQQLENHLYAYPHPQAADQLERVKSDYMLMTGYWQQGYDDPERGQVYDRLLRRMYVLTTNVCIRHYIKNSSFVMGVYNRTRNGSRREWQPASLRRDMEAFVAGAGGTNPDDGLDIVEVEKLIGVDGDGGNAHAMSHHAHGFAFVGARVAQHAADFIELYRVFQVALRHELDAQRVSGHDDKRCNLAFFGADMRGRGITHKGLLNKAGKVAGKKYIGY